VTSPSRRPRASLATLAILGALIALPAPALAATTEAPEPTPAATDAAPTDAPTPPAEEPSTTPAAAPSPTPSPTGSPAPARFTVERAWADPTVLSPDGNPTVSATMVFPPIDPAVFAVAQGNVPLGLSDSVHCTVSRPENGTSTIRCEFLGTPRPGDSTLSIRVRSEAGDDYSASIPVTMCPLTGCSPLFEVTATQTATIETCPDESFTLTGAFDFNLPWNAIGAALADDAPDGVTLTATGVRDGSAFAVGGALTEPGEQSIPIIVTDEFGVGHATTVDVTVSSPSPTLCSSLAATGAAPVSATALGVAALALLAAGVIGLQYSRARSGATRLEG
jgi:hypothetical protein